LRKKRAIITGFTGQNGSYLIALLLANNYEVHGVTSRKTALVSGATGQDGSYLLETLLEKNYEVHSIERRLSTRNASHIQKTLETYSGAIHCHAGNMSDATSITRIIGDVEPDEIYNLAAQSDVGVSFSCPEETGDISGLGVLRMLEAVRILRLQDRVRFYQASTSELFGGVGERIKDESTPFHPRSPYGVAKLYGYWITVNYREAYGFHASNGILFNHESPRRGENFVTRKITVGASRLYLGQQECLFLGNLDAKRDWGHARDYVEAQWLILQQEKGGDYVIATGVQHSVREFVSKVFERLGAELSWSGKGIHETAVVENINRDDRDCKMSNGDIVVRVDPSFYRPADVNDLLGDSTLARKELGWEPKTSFNELVNEMTDYDLERAKRDRDFT
jgi:GDPmannose 4,6-dehydratase